MILVSRFTHFLSSDKDCYQIYGILYKKGLIRLWNRLFAICMRYHGTM